MMNLRPLVLPLVILGVVATGFYCETLSVGTAGPGPVHVVYWEKWTGFEFDAMKKVVDDFNATHKDIQVDMLSTTAIETKTLMAVSAQVAPDVAGLYGANIAQYADDRAVEPLDDLCKESGIKADDYLPAYFNMVTYEGHIWALPSTPASIVLHYNKDMFEKAGLDPEKPPKTIEDLDALSVKLNRVSGGQITQAGFFPPEPGWWNWAWANYFGGKIVDESGKITATSPECIRAMTWIQTFPKKFGGTEYQSFKQGLGNFQSPENPFMEDRLAMEVQGVWMANFINQFKSGLKWGAAPFPYPADRPDLAGTALVDLDVLVIPSGAKHKREAFEFIKFVQTQKEMEKLCLLQWKNTPLSKVSPEFWANHKNPFIKLFYDVSASKNAFSAPKLGVWAQMNAELGSEVDAINLLHKTPKEAMESFTERMQPIVDQYKKRHEMRLARGL